MSKYPHSSSVSSSEDIFLVPRSRKIAKMGAGFILVLLLAGFGIIGWSSLQSSRLQKADALLTQAITVYTTPLLEEKGEKKEENADLIPAAIPRFQKSEERAQASLKLLEQLYQEFGSTPSADLGRTFQAHILLEQGKTGEAQALYQKIASTSIIKSNTWNAAIMENQAIILEQQKKPAEAQKIYEEQSSKAPLFYQPFFSLHLAQLYHEQGDQKKAKEFYQKVLQGQKISTSFRDIAEARVLPSSL